MTDSPFAKPSAPTSLAEGHEQAPADDLDFDATPPPILLGIFLGHVKAVKKGAAGTKVAGSLIIEFKLDEGPLVEVAKFADPNKADELVKIGQVVNALGAEMVEQGGQLKPECGWLGLVGRQARIVLDEWGGKYTIPRFGKAQSDQFPANLKDRDFGCGILPIE